MERRNFLIAASTNLALAALGLGRIEATRGENRKPLITCFLSGGASAKETFNPDPPNISEDLRGPLGSIQTRTGQRFSELFPMLAERSDTFSVIRSLDSGSSDHNASAINLLQKEGKTVAEMVGDRASDGGVPYVLLSPGRTYFNQILRQSDSFAPSYREGRFLAPDMPQSDMTERKALLEAFDTPVPSPISDRHDRFRQTAFDLLQGGGRFFEALNLPENERDRYGRNTAGDGMLLAKRFIERGAGAVTFYHEPTGSAWDLHNGIEAGMRSLSPEIDRAASAIIDEINTGSLNAVFLLATEFNRTSLVNRSAGRDHHPQGSVAILAGGKARRGVTHGRTNARGEIMDGRVQQRDQFANTILLASGEILSPAQPRVREVLL